MRFRLRALLIFLAIGPPLVAWGWLAYQDYVLRQADIDLVLSNLSTAMRR